MSVRFEAICVEGEVLRCEIMGKQPRPSLELSPGNDCLVFGKNGLTQIADSSLKRKMVRIKLSSEKQDLVQLELLEPTKVSVNGTMHRTNARHNDIICLHGAECRYDYRVLFPVPAAKTSHTVSNDSSASSNKLSDDVSCPVCLDFMVHCHSVVPCGHSYCQSCVPSNGNCHVCRTAFDVTIPNKSLDSVIETLIQHHPEPFSPDDIVSYNHRKQQVSRKRKHR